MLEAALHSDTMAGQQRELRRAVRQAFERGKAVDRRDLADRVHLRVDVERRQARGTLVEIGDALAELLADVRSSEPGIDVPVP